jgi:sporulation protein YlmC with PRC-barrel domain
MRVDLHAKVVTRDGDEVGHIQHAVVDPETNEITQYVISTGGLLGNDVLVERAHVEQIDSNGELVRLNIDKHQLDGMPVYLPADYGAPPPDWIPPPTTTFPYAGFLWPATHMPPAEDSAVREAWQARRDVLIDRGCAVVDRSGNDVGMVDEIVLTPDGAHLEAFDVRLGGALRTMFPGGDIVRLGMDVVASVEPMSVRLRVDKESLPKSRN